MATQWSTIQSLDDGSGLYVAPVSPIYNAIDLAGNYFVNDGRTRLILKGNVSIDSAAYVTVSGQKDCRDGYSHNVVTDADLSDPDARVYLGPFPIDWYNDANGYAQVTFTGTGISNLTVAVIRDGPRVPAPTSPRSSGMDSTTTPLTVQTPNRVAGVLASFQAIDNANGNRFPNNGRTWAHFKGNAAATGTFIVTETAKCSCGSKHATNSSAGSLNATTKEQVIGPFQRDVFNWASETCRITYNTLTGATVALISEAT